MKVLLLSDPNSVHTIKWATSLAERGVNICIVGIGALEVSKYSEYPNIIVKTLGQTVIRKEGALSKIKYLLILKVLREAIKQFEPDILHAHYGSSYGLIGALSGFTPLITSVWGSDVFSFPNKSFIHKKIIQFNLRRASSILSTSEIMAKETRKYTGKDVIVTPFGIDLEFFDRKEVVNDFHSDDIVIGTIKTLEEKYGIEYLIKAFKLLVDRHPELPLKLLIVGGGSLESSLKQLCEQQNIKERVFFTGKVEYDSVPEYHNQLTISVFVSIEDSESFGVAILEASACERPVIVSRVGGLPEVVEEGVTGLIVPPADSEKTAEAIETLLLDPELRDKMGKAGRKRVKKIYDWNSNVSEMIKIYRDILIN